MNVPDHTLKMPPLKKSRHFQKVTWQFTVQVVTYRISLNSQKTELLATTSSKYISLTTLVFVHILTVICLANTRHNTIMFLNRENKNNYYAIAKIIFRARINITAQPNTKSLKAITVTLHVLFSFVCLTLLAGCLDTAFELVVHMHNHETIIKIYYLFLPSYVNSI